MTQKILHLHAYRNTQDGITSIEPQDFVKMYMDTRISVGVFQSFVVSAKNSLTANHVRHRTVKGFHKYQRSV